MAPNGVGLTSWGEGASFALVIKIPSGVDDLLHGPVSHTIFSFGLVTTESDSFLIRIHSMQGWTATTDELRLA